MNITPSRSLKRRACETKSLVCEEFDQAQGADFIEPTAKPDEPTSESGADVANFRAKSVLFGVSMEALTSGVDEALSLRADEDKPSKIRNVLNIFKPRIEFSDGEVTANTTGDTVDPRTTLVIAKEQAQVRTDAKGREQVLVKQGDQEHWIPKESFQDVGGKDGAYYLPTYSASPLGAAIGGGAKTLLTFGPVGALATGGAGFAAHKFGKSQSAKFALGAGLGAALFAATNAVFNQPLSVGASLLLGASAGLFGVHVGEGESAIRDASYSGGLATFGAASVTQDPLLGLHSAAAAGLGARAKSPEMKTLISGVTGAALGAVHGVLTGQSAGLMAGVSAAAAVAGTLAGPPVMQASRNLSHSGGEILGKVLQKAPDPVLKVVGTVPFAAGMGFLGAGAGLIIPGAGAIGAAFGTIGGAALGASKTAAKLKAARLEEDHEPKDKARP